MLWAWLTLWEEPALEGGVKSGRLKGDSASDLTYFDGHGGAPLMLESSLGGGHR